MALIDDVVSALFSYERKFQGQYRWSNPRPQLRENNDHQQKPLAVTDLLKGQIFR